MDPTLTLTFPRGIIEEHQALIKHWVGRYYWYYGCSNRIDIIKNNDGHNTPVVMFSFGAGQAIILVVNHSSIGMGVDRGNHSSVHHTEPYYVDLNDPNSLDKVDQWFHDAVTVNGFKVQGYFKDVPLFNPFGDNIWPKL